MNKTEMNVFHREFQKYLDKHSEKDLYPVLNGTTVGGNRTIAELKAESALEDAARASRQAQQEKEAPNETVTRVKEEVKEVQSTIVNMQKARLIAEQDMETWMDDLEKKELPAVTKLQDELRDLGASKDDYDNIKSFAEALEHPIKGNTGETYVEIPHPEKTLPLLKKIVKKLTAVIDKTREITRKVTEKATRTKVSVKEKPAKYTAESKNRNTERKPTHKRDDVSL